MSLFKSDKHAWFLCVLLQNTKEWQILRFIWKDQPFRSISFHEMDAHIVVGIFNQRRVAEVPPWAGQKVFCTSTTRLLRFRRQECEQAQQRLVFDFFSSAETSGSLQVYTSGKHLRKRAEAESRSSTPTCRPACRLTVAVKIFCLSEADRLEEDVCFCFNHPRSRVLLDTKKRCLFLIPAQTFCSC